MNGYIITLFNDAYSTKMSKKVTESAKKYAPTLNLIPWRATTPEECVAEDYSYPHEGQVKQYKDIELVGYRAKDVRKKIACSISHLRLWEVCDKGGAPIVVLEHDAVFVRNFNAYSIFRKLDDGDILMLNDPRGATRRGQKYHENILSHGFGVHPIDGVNYENENVPDGLAGNSAYIMTPKSAKKAIRLQREIGIWPNDALICKQFFGSNLKSIYPYKTVVQQTISTTVG